MEKNHNLKFAKSLHDSKVHLKIFNDWIKIFGKKGKRKKTTKNTNPSRNFASVTEPEILFHRKNFAAYILIVLF